MFFPLVLRVSRARFRYFCVQRGLHTYPFTVENLFLFGLVPFEGFDVATELRKYVVRTRFVQHRRRRAPVAHLSFSHPYVFTTPTESPTQAFILLPACHVGACATVAHRTLDVLRRVPVCTAWPDLMLILHHDVLFPPARWVVLLLVCFWSYFCAVMLRFALASCFPRYPQL